MREAKRAAASALMVVRASRLFFRQDDEVDDPFSRFNVRSNNFSLTHENHFIGVACDVRVLNHHAIPPPITIRAVTLPRTVRREERLVRNEASKRRALSDKEEG